MIEIDLPLGRVGMTEREARVSGRQAIVGRIPMSRVGRARERDETSACASSRSAQPVLPAVSIPLLVMILLLIAILILLPHYGVTRLVKVTLLLKLMLLLHLFGIPVP